MMVNAVALVCVVGAIALVGRGMARELDQRSRLEETRVALEEIRRELLARTDHGALEGAAWPERIDPGWFDGALPRNALVSGARPWIEIEKVSSRNDPDEIEARTSSEASFWYNPRTGSVRARVPVMDSRGEARELYERANANAR